MLPRLDRGLARFGVDGADVTFVRHGENTTYRVVSRGRAFALRIHRHGYQTRASVRSEIAWMEALRADGLATPEAIPGLSGDVVEEADLGEGPQLLALFTWVDGEPFARLDRPELWARLGSIMAAVHTHGRAFVRPPGFVRQSWDAEGMVGTARPLWGDPVALGTWSAEEAMQIEAAREAVLGRLAGLPKTADRYGLVHGDLAFENVLVQPDGTTVVIDFDDCGTSWFLWELAVALFPFDGERGFDERRAALVGGYRQVAPLPEEVLAELPTFVMARRIATLGWLFTHAGTAHAEAQRAWRLRTLGPAIDWYLNWASSE